MNRPTMSDLSTTALRHDARQYIFDKPVDNEFENATLARLQRAVVEVTALNRVLAENQEQSKVDLNDVKTLVETNLQLTYELTLLMQKESKTRYLAYHDDLTGLPNRRLLRDRLKQAIAQAARQSKQVVVLLLDLDGFKEVNDRLGHWAGDELLQQVAKRLTQCVRVADTVCRYGGDEFVVMSPEFDEGATSSILAEKIRTALTAPYTIDEKLCNVNASMGVAVYPGDGRNYEMLLKQADIDMYRAKSKFVPTQSATRQFPVRLGM